jgi:hypothetical protein
LLCNEDECPEEDHGLKNWRDTDRQPRHIVEMTLKTSPELMNALLSLLVVKERKQCGEGMRKNGRLEICLKSG